MVVLVDLEEEGHEPTIEPLDIGSTLHHATTGFLGQNPQPSQEAVERENPNLDSLFSASLSCYP